MATKPISTTKVFLVTSQEPTSATLTHGKSMITWDVLTEGGQTTVIVPAGATLSLSSETALLSPLPATFKSAPAAAHPLSGGESLRLQSAETPELPMRHATWVQLAAEAAGCTVTPAAVGKAVAMQLLFSPAEDVLSPATFFSGAEWLYKAPIMPAGYTYVITLTQFPVQGSARVFANLSAIIPNTAA